MDWWLASFFLGAILSLFLPIVPDLFVLFLLLLLAICFFYVTVNSSKPLRLSSGVFFGMSWMLLSAFDFQQVWQENNVNAIALSNKAVPVAVNVPAVLIQVVPQTVTLSALSINVPAV